MFSLRSRRPAVIVLVAASLLIAAALRLRPAHAAAGVTAEYGFSEGSGAQTDDSSPNNFTGFLSGGVAWTAGHTGTALRFNGSSSYVDVGNPSALQGPGSVTMSAWVFETANVGGDGQIVAKSDGTRGWQLKSSASTGSRTFAIEVGSSNGQRARRHSRTVRVLNRWYHVAGVYNAAARTLNIYVDGVLDNGTLTGSVPSSQRNDVFSINIGRRIGGSYLDGIVDDVRVYTRPLAASEIDSDMNTPAGRDLTPPVVSLTAPGEGTFVSGSGVAIDATASDNVGVAGVQVLVDDSALGGEDVTAPYSAAWNTTTASEGRHTLSARARDAAGNVTTSAVRTVTVDNTPPATGSVIIDGGAALTSALAVTLALSAADEASGVGQMRFSNTGTAYSAAEPYATTKAWTLASGPSGDRTVYVQFRDGAGNWSPALADSIMWDGVAPDLLAVAASTVTPTSAAISWTTDEASTSRVDYGPTAAYGVSTALDATLVTDHVVPLDGLAPDTTYHYRVRSRDAAGNERVGGDNVFTTPAGPDTLAPSVPAAVAATVVSSTQAQVTWAAASDNVAVTDYEVFRDGVAIATTPTTSLADGALVPLTTYAYTVVARDAAGNASAPSAPAGVTLPAFVITNVQVTNISMTRATVTWATDQPADSGVEYGTTPAYGQTTAPDGVLTTSHSRRLIGLTPDTTYHYRVRSTDAAGNAVVSSDAVFSTAATSGVFQNEIVLSGFDLPTALKFLPDGSMLVLELGGTIRRVDTATWTVAPSPFLVLTNIGTLNGQQGLMDLVLDPDFATNRHYYVFYTRGTPNNDRVSRFTATGDLTGTVAGSEVVIYADPDPAHAEHHGGALNFGGDGKLYITTGEHFSPADAQSLSTPRGKLLRVNKDGTVPADNPFHDGAGPNVDAIWALGLRNPFRAFYDAPTDRLYIADVGGNNGTPWEEVHIGARGANYGWPVCEGLTCSGNPAYTDPWFVYGHDGRDASITGGFVYRGSQFPVSYRGNYFFGDYAQNWIKRLVLDAAGNVTGVENFEPPDGAPDGPAGDIVYLAEGPDGAIYYVDLGFSDTTGQTTVGRVRRIRFIADNQPPAVTAVAQPASGPVPLTVAFSSEGTFDPDDDPLTYLWTFGDGAQSTEPSPSHTYVTPGPYTVRLAVSDGTSSTQSAPLAISAGQVPVVTLLAPEDGRLFRSGETIAFSGDAMDAEDGPLPASAFSWTIDFLHDGHVHPALPLPGVKEGTFVIPTEGHDFSGNTRYQITLTVTDSHGLRASRSAVVYPEKTTIEVHSVPAGLSVHLDGIPYTAPFVHDTLVGFTHTIAAPNQQVGQDLYSFQSWSDGGAQQHAVAAGAGGPYVATFEFVPPSHPPGLIAGYKFSEGSGTTTADVSGNAIAGALSGAVAWSAAGKDGGALAFNGGFVDLGNPTLLRMTGSMTLAAWIKASEWPWDDASIIAKLQVAGWQLKTSPDTGQRTAAIQISGDGATAVQRYSNTVLALDTWYHVAAVYDADARTLDIYVNGVLDNGALAGTVPAAQVDAAYDVHIGQRTGLPDTFNFRGVIDEPHIYNRALTAAEVQMDMKTPR